MQPSQNNKQGTHSRHPFNAPFWTKNPTTGFIRTVEQMELQEKLQQLRHIDGCAELTRL